MHIIHFDKIKHNINLIEGKTPLVHKKDNVRQSKSALQLEKILVMAYCQCIFGFIEGHM